MTQTAGSAGSDAALSRDRYGRRAPVQGKDRKLRIAFVVFLVLLVSGTVWIGLDQANRDVTASIPSYRVTSDRTVEVQLEVRKDKGKEAVCVLRSRGGDGAEVGRKEVRVPAGVANTTLTEVLETTDRPNTAELDGCRIV